VREGARVDAVKRFVILSGPSCVGKGPLQAAVRRLHPGLIDARPILCTSRAPREGEVHGRDFHFLPEAFIRSLAACADFAVSPVRSDWQAIHLPQVADLLRSRPLVFAEVYPTFGPALLERAAGLGFECVRIFLLPLPPETPAAEVVRVMRAKLERRAADPAEKIGERAASAPHEIAESRAYTHRLVNPAGEDDVDEWKSLATCGGRHGTGEVNAIGDLGPKAKWLVETFVKIVRGELGPGDFARGGA
jgi:guanylate kinase